MYYINPDFYPQIFKIIPVGRQLHPYYNFEEDNCEIIIDTVINSYCLRVPGSGSHYIMISEEQAKKYMGQ